MYSTSQGSDLSFDSDVSAASSPPDDNLHPIPTVLNLDPPYAAADEREAMTDAVAEEAYGQLDRTVGYTTDLDLDLLRTTTLDSTVSPVPAPRKAPKVVKEDTLRAADVAAVEIREQVQGHVRSPVLAR